MSKRNPRDIMQQQRAGAKNVAAQTAHLTEPAPPPEPERPTPPAPEPPSERPGASPMERAFDIASEHIGAVVGELDGDVTQLDIDVARQVLRQAAAVDRVNRAGWRAAFDRLLSKVDTLIPGVHLPDEMRAFLPIIRYSVMSGLAPEPAGEHPLERIADTL